MNKVHRLTALAWLLALATVLSGLDVPRAARAQNAGAGDTTFRATRIDVAHAYQRLDAQFMERLADRDVEPPAGVDADSPQWRRWTLQDDGALAEINRQVDRATMSFFSGDIGRVTRLMHELLEPRPGSKRDAAFLQLAWSLHVEIMPARPTPAELDQDGSGIGACEITLRSIYPLPEAIELPDACAVGLALQSENSSRVSYHAIQLEMDPSRYVRGSVRVVFDESIEPGRRTILLRSGGVHGVHEPIGEWTVLPEAPAAARLSLTRRLEAARSVEAEPALQFAMDQLAQRISLLELADSASSNIALLTDYARLMGELERECRAIESGLNPYVGRTGDWWTRARLAEAVHIPVRIYVPEADRAEHAMPLIIVLHGAGGDENLFMEAYGDGVIKRLADQHGLAVVSPQASPLMDLGMAFDALVEMMGELYRIDEHRVYIVGHSMGAMMTGGMSAARHEQVAAACWLAGASFARGATIPPTLAIGAELDSLIRPERVRAAVEMAREAGMEIEYRELEHFGHTLMVGHALPEVVQWLLEHTLSRN